MDLYNFKDFSVSHKVRISNWIYPGLHMIWQPFSDDVLV